MISVIHVPPNVCFKTHVSIFAREHSSKWEKSSRLCEALNFYLVAPLHLELTSSGSSVVEAVAKVNRSAHRHKHLLLSFLHRKTSTIGTRLSWHMGRVATARHLQILSPEWKGVERVFHLPASRGVAEICYRVEPLSVTQSSVRLLERCHSWIKLLDLFFLTLCYTTQQELAPNNSPFLFAISGASIHGQIMRRKFHASMK